MLEIRLLGQFDLQVDGRLVHLRSRPAQVLLAYLALQPGLMHRREKLAGVIWPETAEESARRNLRQALWQVREAVGRERVQADRLAIGLAAGETCWVDCATLAETPENGALEALKGALSLYRGELLPGFYEEWILVARERLRRQYDRRAGRLVASLEDEARWAEAVEWAEHWITHGSRMESAFRALMRAHGGLGDMAGLAAVYRRCQQTLREELMVPPSAETQALYRQLTSDSGAEGQAAKASAGGARERQDVHRTSKFALLNRLAGSRLVGREYELAELRAFWTRARRESGHLVLLAGEAGIGKSRLARELAREVEQQGGLVMQGHYYSELAAPYLGFWEALRDCLRSMPSEEAAGLLRPLAPELVKLVPEVADIVGPIAPSPRLGTTEAERLRLFDHVSRFIGRRAAGAPLLFLLEDLHWADEASTLLLMYVVRLARSMPVLFLGTYRDEEIEATHPLHQALLSLNRERLYTRLKLDPLPWPQVNRLLATLLAGPAEPELGDRVLEASGGVPLFIEEMVKSWLERDAIRLEFGRWRLVAADADARVPHAIDLMIRNRVAGLGQDCQEALRSAAVLGTGFEVAPLRRVLGWPEQRLLDALDEGARAGLLRNGQRRDGQHFQFHHALTPQSLYAELSGRERADAHLRAAEALEAIYADSAAEHVETLADHFLKAGEAGAIRAAGYLLQSAEKAAAVYAYDQAVAYLRRGLDLLGNYPDLPGKDHDEVRLLLTLGPMLGNTVGRWNEEMGRIFSRAEALCRQVDAPVEEQFMATRGLWYYRHAAGHMEDLPAVSERLVALAEASGNSGLLMEAYHALWGYEHGLGNAVQAQVYYDRGKELFDLEAHRWLSASFGHDPGTCCLNMGALNLWLLGYPDRALEWSREAQAVGEQMELPFDRLCGLNAYVWVHEMRGEFDQAAAWNEKKLALARETEFAQFVIGALGSQGLARAWQGRQEEGLALVGEAMEKNRSAGRYEPLTLMRFLQVCLITGHLDEGLQAMEEALAMNEEVGERFLEPELRRLYGELLLRSGREAADAEAEFQRALQGARTQGTRSLELRAATSLARLWQAQGQPGGARQLLRPIYEWFGEGLETADLREARRVLDGLEVGS